MQFVSALSRLVLSRRLRLPGLGLLAATAFATPVLAQMAPGMGGSMGGMGPVGPVHTGGVQDTPTQSPPPALPGSRVNPPTAAPAEHVVADMSPNDALFDAINRGDTVAARDALSRGARLEATNILGMTPLDLSVDLGRNDITFVLLSMRGADGTSARPAPALVADASDHPAHPARQSRAASPAATRVSATSPAAAAAPMPAPTGTPNPQMGFLGFATK